MTDLQASEVGRIAKGLTKAQREACFRTDMRYDQPYLLIPNTKTGTLRALQRLGLINELWTRLTPLGLAVRRHLEGGV